MKTTITLVGGPALERRLKALGKAPAATLKEIGIRGVAEAKRLVPRRTGNLGRTIRVAAITDRYVEVSAGGAAASGYAAAVEYGTKPHVIVPRRRKALAWGGPRTLGGRLRVSGGVTASPTNFARRVRHPGTKAKPYLRPGIQKALDQVGVGEIVRVWNEAS